MIGYSLTGSPREMLKSCRGSRSGRRRLRGWNASANTRSIWLRHRPRSGTMTPIRNFEAAASEALSSMLRAHSAAARISRVRSTRPRRTPSLVESGKVRPRILTPRFVRESKTRCWTGVSSRNPATSTSLGIGIAPSPTRFATNAGSSAPDNQPLSRHRRLNTLAHRWKVSESAESLHSGASSGRAQAHRRFQASRAASAVAGTSSSRFLAPERTMSSQTTHSSAGLSRRGIGLVGPEYNQPVHNSESQAEKGRIWAAGQEERPAASCFRS